ncbi:hypothetical protein [Sphingobacterium deserti]|uniref:Uncharacterized protein n=1 Tax=Sphingobacterium deserti TaxID=1229276 RepID=A0A0B8SYR3_9SPHI|nr:hypothetical protein [Sphingobacterium deserti]KGE12542.1 hypothetical protein DI53_3582 [Sphingobacterium deserti]
MKISTNIVAGAAGALLLNVIHELARKNIKDAPRVNELGEEGVVKISEAMGVKPPTGNKLYASTLAYDFVGNAFYYSAVGKGKSKNIWLRGLGLGLTAGIGAIALPKKIGLDDQPVNHSKLTQVLTVAWYTLGGLAAAAAAELLKESPSNGESE